MQPALLLILNYAKLTKPSRPDCSMVTPDTLWSCCGCRSSSGAQVHGTGGSGAAAVVVEKDHTVVLCDDTSALLYEVLRLTQ